MKYGYLFYRKPLRPEKRNRPMNMGDPIQALAAINLFREMGIPNEDIMPVDRYDTASYDGEEVVLAVNTAENYEHLCYESHFFPMAPKIKPIIMSLHLHRHVSEEEIDFLRKNEPIGCRDEATFIFMRELGIEAYISGCLTFTFPQRAKTEHQNKVFLVDCPSKLLDFIPRELCDESIALSNIIKIDSNSETNRITKKEAENYHRISYEQIWRLRDEAKLVVTSRLHIATPCLAMGIPVILAKDSSFDMRFGFIDKYIPLYTHEHFHEIDWNPVPPNIEYEKKLVKECFFSNVKATVLRTQVGAMYENRLRQAICSYGIDIRLSKIPLPKDKPFKYAIWGVCLHLAFLLHNQITSDFPKAVLVNAIDTYASGKVLDVDIIHPNQIADIDEEIIIFVTAPSAQESAKELLENTGRPFVLIGNVNPEWYNLCREN